MSLKYLKHLKTYVCKHVLKLGLCWFVAREKYCTFAGKYCWSSLSEQGHVTVLHVCRWDGCSVHDERPRAGEGHGEQTGAVPTTRRPCAGQKPQRKGIGRRWWERPSRAGHVMSDSERRRLESAASRRSYPLMKHYDFINSKGVFIIEHHT
jgi:hypothetical protein